MSTSLFKKGVLFVIGFFACVNVLYAQNTVSGKVKDAEGNALEGITVQVKGTNTATSTDRRGNYSIEAAAGQVLVFTSAGYTLQESAVTGKKAADIALVLENKGLDEVVVIGYGTQKKRDLTGAVSSVKTKDLVLSSGPEIGGMLKGKVAGLTIRQNSAQPGGGLDILVRGQGYDPDNTGKYAPLIVVDGFPLTDLDAYPSDGTSRYKPGSQSVLGSFNPNDIESIEVLKDASTTSIYGARAANGVILITTKRGAEGAVKVQYSNNFSVQKFKNPFDVLPLNEWMQVRNEAGQEQWDYDNGVIPYGTKTREEAQLNPVNGQYKKLYTQNAINNVGRGTDWFDLVTRDGFTAQHNLSFSGGTKSTRYLLSGNYYGQDGIVKNSGLKRYSIRANIDQVVNKYVSIGMNLTMSRIDNNNTQLGGDQFEFSGIIRSAIQQGPHILAIDENGNYPINPQLALQPNPYSLLTITDQSRTERMLLNSFIDITPVKDIVVRLKAGMDRGSSERDSYLPTSTLFGALENGKAAIGRNENNSYLLEATGNYKHTFASVHKVDALIGLSQQKFNNEAATSGASGFITDAFLWHNLAAGNAQSVATSYAQKNIIASYFGRINYSYKNRYLLTATVRRDGSSVFARNNKWGNFPSAAVGWDISEEPFFKNLTSVFSQLKFRFSYGQTGNATINSNAFAAYSAYRAWLSANDIPLTGVSLYRLENPDLKWETTTGANLGLDFSILKGRIDGSIELFNNVISDILQVKNLNSYQPINSIFANVGKTRSKGLEVTINTRNVQTKDFSWRTTFVFSKYKDNWDERAPDWKPAVYESEKDPIRARYYRLSDGILQIGETAPASQPELKPGMIKIKDIDGYVRDGAGNPSVDANGRFLRTGAADGIIDDADTRLLGTIDPKGQAGITNILTYKNFSLNFDFTALFGRNQEDPNYTAYGISAYGVYSNGYNALRSVKDRWTPTNPSTTQPSSFWGFSPYGVGDFFQEKAWFIRMQNISLGYNLPRTILSKVFTNLRVHADASNLFVISPYKGVDPETDSYTAAYPYIRTFTLGLNVTF